jgi:hypothetical protein
VDLTARDKLLAFFFFSALTLALTYPLVLAPRTANRLDSPDARLNSWIVSWNLYQLPRDPLRVFDANIFFPEKKVLALSENLLTGALLAAPAALVDSSPVFLFNVVLLAGFVSSAYAAFLLAHDLTGIRFSAVLAGVLFGFAPYRFAHIPHLQLQLAFGIPLSLYFARRVFREGGAGPVIGLALAAPLLFGSSVYYFVYGASAVPVLALFELSETKAKLRGVYRLSLAGLAGALLTLPLAWPYWEKLGSGMERSLSTASEFEASGLDYLSSFSRVHGFLPKESEPLFPGFVAIGLAALALAKERRRAWVWVAIALLGIALSLGPSLGLFSFLYEIFPPYRALRVPSRAGILFLLSMAMLAALGLSRLRRPFASALLVAAAVAEGAALPLPLLLSAPALPPIYRHLEAAGEGALLELPLPPPESFQDNALYVFRSAYHRRPLVNGYSGFVPENYREVYERLRTQPMPEVLSWLSSLGVRLVLVHEGRIGPRLRREILEAEREGNLILEGEEPGDRLYRITVRSSS